MTMPKKSIYNLSSKKYVDGSIGQYIKILSRCKIISREVMISYQKKSDSLS
jgi:hypothetical protein